MHRHNTQRRSTSISQDNASKGDGLEQMPQGRPLDRSLEHCQLVACPSASTAFIFPARTTLRYARRVLQYHGVEGTSSRGPRSHAAAGVSAQMTGFCVGNRVYRKNAVQVFPCHRDTNMDGISVLALDQAAVYFVSFLVC